MISPYAVIKTKLYSPTVVVYGRTYIGENTILFGFSEIGYPSRDTIKRFLEENRDARDLTRLIEYGEGSVIGEDCVIRSFNLIYERTVLGRGVRTGHNVIIRENTRIGDETLVGSGTIIDGDVVIGRGVSIQSGVYIPPRVVIRDRVFIGPRAVFTNDRYPPSRRLVETIVEEDVVIGANSTIVAGVRIGRGSVVGAGSVVTRDVPDYTVVVGNPARPIMTRDEYEKKREVYERGLEGRDSV